LHLTPHIAQTTNTTRPYRFNYSHYYYYYYYYFIMPALTVFGKRTLLAGDDLRTYGLITLLCRLVQVAASISLVVYVEQAYTETPAAVKVEEIIVKEVCHLDILDSVKEKNAIYALLGLAVTLSVFGATYAALVLVFSQRGTPTKSDARMKPLQYICQFHLTFVVLLRILVVGFGMRAHANMDTLCNCLEKGSFRVMDLCDTTFYCLFFFVVYSELAELCIDLAMNASVFFSWILPKLIPSRMVLDSESKWRICCQCCCTVTSLMTCCLMGGREAVLKDFTDVAILLSDFFNWHGTLDITYSDMVIGFLLVREVQRQREVEVKQMIMSASKEEDTPNNSLRKYYHEPQRHNESDRENLQNAVRAYKNTHCLSQVTYRLQRFDGGKQHWQPAMIKLLQDGDDTDRLVISEGARFMRLSLGIYSWIMYSTNRPFYGVCSLLFASAARSCEKNLVRYEGDGFFCRMNSTSLMKVAGITDENEIVYAYFRSDVVASPYAVVLDHEWKSIVIVIRGTESMEDVLTDLNLTPQPFDEMDASGEQGEIRYVHGGMLDTCKWILQDMKKHEILDKLYNAQSSKYSHYQLRLTGHSLGAGCAAILGMMLKPTYPNLKCHCFSPPGCTMSENAAIECEEYLTSYVVDTDIVPRASLNALQNLRQDTVEMIARVKVSKSQVLDEFTGPGCRRGNPQENVLDRLLYKEDEVPEYSKAWLDNRQEYDEKESGGWSRRLSLELFCPGKIVHFFQRRKKEYRARWANRLDFREIQLSKHFVKDHMPPTVLGVLEGEASRIGLTLPFLEDA